MYGPVTCKAEIWDKASIQSTTPPPPNFRCFIPFLAHCTGSGSGSSTRDRSLGIDCTRPAGTLREQMVAGVQTDCTRGPGSLTEVIVPRGAGTLAVQIVLIVPQIAGTLCERSVVASSSLIPAPAVSTPESGATSMFPLVLEHWKTPPHPHGQFHSTSAAASLPVPKV